ncbi:GDSL-type esterase/lipase family protein [Streptomyces olivoreticuli]|uniref:GDSL-type esterase/lipase family protein n=1 Tax=Streptomyces olivoreticuli TaxID=68246 RepID=UPI00265A8E62|nr:GDSL-type esterase/lipase family protein [Streptomyces olivoreticuli]WKK22190.1 GDSL-type esterase/lipase family protein [Streptomyces olivoreticuli]
MCLVLLLAMAMVAGPFGGPQSKAHALARVNAHRAATFNNQYTNRWQYDIYPLTQQVEVLALQEVRDDFPPDVEPEDGTRVPRQTTSHGYTVDRYRWTACPTGRTCAIYMVRTRQHQRSLAIVVNQPRDSVIAVDIIPPQPVWSWPFRPDVADDAKPALGVQLADGTWFYCIHAKNRARDDQRNDVPSLVHEISRVAGSHWAVLGDFNRTPDSLTGTPALDDNEEIVRSGLPTFKRQNPVSELDYMLSVGIPSPRQYTGFRLTYMQTSDHFPVGFWESSAVSPPGREYVCAPGVNETLRDSRATCIPPKPPVTVSMGDSYLSGEAGRWAGNADTAPSGTVWGTDRAAINCITEDRCAHDLDQVYGPTSYDEGGNRCDRSDTAPILTADYPGVDPWQHFNIACSGAKTSEITGPYKGKNEQAQTEQLAAIAGHYKVKMIAVSIGGNDLGFSDIVRDCAKRYLFSPFYDYCRDVWGDRADQLKAVESKVTSVLSAIRDTMEHAGYGTDDYRLVLQSYPSPLPPSKEYRYPREDRKRYSEGGCPFFDVDTDWARRTLVDGMAEKLRNAAHSEGAVFLDVRDVFARHELCSTYAYQADKRDSAADPLPANFAEWVRWIPYLYSADLVWDSQGDQQEALHPNAFGQQVLGRCLGDLGTLIGKRAPTTDFTCVNDPMEGILVRKG